jgi:hypothetical protein
MELNKNKVISMPVVMSIDVGIKHLAICIMDKDSETKKWNMLLWEVFNTMAVEESSTICNGTFKNGKICNRKSCKKTDTEFFCKSHAPTECKNVRPNKKVLQMSYPEIGTGLLCCMENLFVNHPGIMDRVESIGIELQLAKNPRMKFASHCILSKLIDIYRLRSKQIPIKFIRASLKLKVKYSGPPIVFTVKGAYSQRKKCAIAYTRHFLELLEFDQEWKDLFENCPTKRDDLGETALMCMIMLKYPMTPVVRKPRAVKYNKLGRK